MRTLHPRLAALFVAGCVAAPPAWGAFGRGDAGTSGAQFLKLGAGARAEGMGQAYSAVVNEASAMYWNPAALARIEGHSATFMHASLLGGVNYEFFGYGRKLKDRGYLGAAAQYVARPAIRQTDSAGFAAGGDFSPNDLAVAFGYAREIRREALDGASLGLTGKYIRSTITRSASTFASDLGFLSPKIAIRDKNLRFALVLQNLGGGLKYHNDRDPLPLAFRVASALSLSDAWVAALDANFPRDNAPYAALGTEYRHRRNRSAQYAGRVGFDSRAWRDVGGWSGVAIGLGAEFERLGLDYAFVPFGRLGMAHRISVSMRWGAESAASAAYEGPRSAGETDMPATAEPRSIGSGGSSEPGPLEEPATWPRVSRRLEELEAKGAQLGERAMAAYRARDYERAFDLFRQAATSGYVPAQAFLGFLYYRGQGVPQDYEAAARWLGKAAGQGNAKAQTLLGRMYFYGQGVMTDYVEAYRWYSRAAAQGDGEAAQWLDQVRGYLSPEQLNRVAIPSP